MNHATKPSDIKPLQARPYVPNLQMRQVAERLKGMPRPIHVTSNVSNFKHLEG